MKGAAVWLGSPAREGPERERASLERRERSGMGLFGAPPRQYAEPEPMRPVPAACSGDGALRTFGSGRLGRKRRWESGIAAEDRARRSLGADGRQRLMLRNRGRRGRGRALVRTVIISAMTLAQGEKRDNRARACSLCALLSSIPTNSFFSFFLSDKRALCSAPSEPSFCQAAIYA